MPTCHPHPQEASRTAGRATVQGSDSATRSSHTLSSPSPTAGETPGVAQVRVPALGGGRASYSSNVSSKELKRHRLAPRPCASLFPAHTPLQTRPTPPTTPLAVWGTRHPAFPTPRHGPSQGSPYTRCPCPRPSGLAAGEGLVHPGRRAALPGRQVHSWVTSPVGRQVPPFWQGEGLQGT